MLVPLIATGAILKVVLQWYRPGHGGDVPLPRTSINAVDCRLVRPRPWLWFFRIIAHRLSWSFYMSLAPRLELMWVYPMGGYGEGYKGAMARMSSCVFVARHPLVFPGDRSNQSYAHI
jgi:hypothetical protein